MICSRCGTVNDGNAVFCDACGHRLVESVVKKKVEEALSGKTKAFIGGLVSVAIALVVMVPLLLPLMVGTAMVKDNFSCQTTPYSHLVYEAKVDEAILWEGAEVYRGGDLGIIGCYGDTAVLADGEKLILLTGSETTVLTESRLQTMPSGDGRVIYYQEIGGRFLRYDVVTGETTEIPWEGDQLVFLAASPSGASLLYRICPNDLTKPSTDYRYHGGVSTAIELDGVSPIGLTDGGEVTYGYALYYEDGLPAGLTLYAMKDGKANKLGVVTYLRDYRLNADGTQLLFHSNGNTYLSVDGGEKVKICSFEAEPVTPEGCVAVKDFRGCLFYGDDTLVSFDFETEKASLIRGVTGVGINASGDTLYYVKNSILYGGAATDVTAASVLSSDLVKAFAFTQDGKYVYYVNSEEQLIARRVKSGKETRIADDAYGVQVTASGEVFALTEYYRDMGELHYGAGEELTRIGSDIYAVFVQGDGVAYGVNYHAESGTFDLCYREDGDTFVPVAEAVKAFGFCP